MNAKYWIVLAAIMGMTSVMLGAFHAHGLSKMLDSKIESFSDEQVRDQMKIAETEKETSGPEIRKMLLQKRMHQFSTSVKYQFYHTFAILAIGLLLYRHSTKCVQLAGWLMVVGTILFSGVLYLIVLTGHSSLGHLVMVGGICQIFGWITLVIAGCRLPSAES